MRHPAPQSHRPDAARLLEWLAVPGNRRTLAESWFWKRYRDAGTDGRGREKTHTALIHAVQSRWEGVPLKWPGDDGRPPSPESQIVILSVAWLRGLVTFGGLALDAVWTWEAIAKLADELGPSHGLPWNTVNDPVKTCHVTRRARERVYGGRFEIVAAPSRLDAVLDLLNQSAA